MFHLIQKVSFFSLFAFHLLLLPFLSFKFLPFGLWYCWIFHLFLKGALRERLSAYTVRKEVVQRLHEQSRSSSSSLPSSSYSHPLSQNNTHPYLTHAQPTSFQQIAPPTATPYGQPTTQSGQPTTYYPTNTPVSNPIPFSMGAGQTRYVDPLHKPTLMERLKKLGL